MKLFDQEAPANQSHSVGYRGQSVIIQVFGGDCAKQATMPWQPLAACLQNLLLFRIGLVAHCLTALYGVLHFLYVITDFAS
jgi:hypothetical protein